MADTEVCYIGGPAPPWLDTNAWCIPVAVKKEYADKMPRIAMQKVELKVNMCCAKCAEIVDEKIRYLGGVFNVKVDQKNSKVTVIGRPDPEKVLRRARKVDKHATFWPAPPPPPPAPVVVVVEEKPKEPEKPKEEKKEEVKEEKKEEKKEEEKKEEKKEEVKEEKKPEENKEEEKKEEKKEEEKKPEGEAKAEEKPKEEEKEEEEKKPEEKPKEEEKKEEEKKPEEKPKEEPAPAPPAVAPVQFPPHEQASFEGFVPFDGYRPSQSYYPLYPDFNHMGYFGPQISYLNPNYFKHVKIAY